MVRVPTVSGENGVAGGGSIKIPPGSAVKSSMKRVAPSNVGVAINNSNDASEIIWTSRTDRDRSIAPPAALNVDKLNCVEFIARPRRRQQVKISYAACLASSALTISTVALLLLSV